MYLVPPPKKGSDIDITKSLKTIILSTVSTPETKAKINANLEKLQNLRQISVRTPSTPEGQTSVISYYDQLVCLEQKVPVIEIQVPFKWRDAFARSSVFGGSRSSLTVPSWFFEKSCILYNVAVAFSANSSASSDDLQKMIKGFQISGGIFNYLSTYVPQWLQDNCTQDLEPNNLSVLSELMLAQAQEVVVIKALKDGMKSGVIAKLSAQCQLLFENVYKKMKAENIWPSDWNSNTKGKKIFYGSMSQYHQAILCKEGKLIGEEISRLQLAETNLSSLSNIVSSDFLDYKNVLKNISTALAAAKKDNDFIYHERIPDKATLAPIAKVPVSKLTTVTQSMKFGSSSEDWFEELTPVHIAQAVALYEAKKQELVNVEMTKIKIATNRLNDLLSSCNLPAAIEDTTGHELPSSLLEKSRLIQEAGGLKHLDTLKNELPELLKRNTEILDEVERLLSEEKESDDQLRIRFKEKWTRTSSSALTTTFTTNVQKYRAIVGTAIQSDKIVNDKLEPQRNAISILDQGHSVIQARLPTGQSLNTKSPTMSKLKDLMERVETLKAERQVLESEFTNIPSDVQSFFSETYNKVGAIDENSVIMESLKRSTASLLDQLNENLSRQESLMSAIVEANEDFVKERRGQNSVDRETQLISFATGADAFFEVLRNLNEGIKFYNDLTQLLVTFQSKVNDFCFARRTEKEELLKDVTSGMATMTMNTPPPRPPQPERPPRKTDEPASQAPPPTTHSIDPSTKYYQNSPPMPSHPVGPSSMQNMAQGPGPYPYHLPYPSQPGMGLPAYTPMPTQFNPFIPYYNYHPYGIMAPQYSGQPYPPPPGYPPTNYPGDQNPQQ